MANDKKDKSPLTYKLTIGRTVKGKLTFAKRDKQQLDATMSAAKSALDSGAKEVIISASRS